MNQSLRVPRSPSGCGRGGQEGGRSCEFGRKAGSIVRVRDHREVPRHVDPGDEDGFDIVAMSGITGEGYPGIIMALRVFFKGGFQLDVFPISAVLGDQSRSLFLSELK